MQKSYVFGAGKKGNTTSKQLLSETERFLDKNANFPLQRRIVGGGIKQRTLLVLVICYDDKAQ
ncbi:MAG: hypothetical protein LBG59_00605 [Candidatus Peribacteria bacterium]|jgi:hypothetical protein|nr:hypothetical protein [Candidatus Peribacteria bacterium]